MDALLTDNFLSTIKNFSINTFKYLKNMVHDYGLTKGYFRWHEQNFLT